jgi:aldehyde:ferredoxin oxidoreductase
MNNKEEWQNTEDILGDLDIARRLFAAVTGVELSQEELDRVAERAFTLERAMLARAGRGRAMEEGLAPHFELPCRADGTLIDEAGFSGMLDEYYSARGWDLELGWPQADHLIELRLEEVVPELDKNRKLARSKLARSPSA